LCILFRNVYHVHIVYCINTYHIYVCTWPTVHIYAHVISCTYMYIQHICISRAVLYILYISYTIYIIYCIYHIHAFNVEKGYRLNKISFCAHYLLTRKTNKCVCEKTCMHAQVCNRHVWTLHWLKMLNLVHLMWNSAKQT
jgi:hypothetical protein